MMKSKLTKKDAHERILKRKYVDIRYKSKKRFGTNNNIMTFSKFVELSKSNCIYCNEKPSLEVKDTYYKDKSKLNTEYTLKVTGIDRIDSSKSYLPDNVEPCCTTCNFLKRAMSKESFIKHINKIAKNLTKNNKEI